MTTVLRIAGHGGFFHIHIHTYRHENGFCWSQETTGSRRSYRVLEERDCMSVMPLCLVVIIMTNVAVWCVVVVLRGG